MIERVVSHPAGRFTRCRQYGAEPRHIRSSGRSSKEPVQFIAEAADHCEAAARGQS